MKKTQTKNLILRHIIALCLLLSSIGLSAQIEVEPAGAIFSAEDLITNIFLGDGVEVTNLVYTGTENAVGYFTNGLGDVGIDRGIIMSSGQAATAATANNGAGTTGFTSGPGTDPDLDAITTSGLNDISKYEITFIPTNDTLQFRYVFASEEYPEYACSNFNDVFGFFISGPNPLGGNYVGENIALVPEPSDPSGTTFTNVPVTINNVNNNGIDPGSGCDYDYATYYNDNSVSTTFTYDAYLDVFIAQAIVIPCEEYTIKLAVADAGDPNFDTSVFLEAKSFGTGSLDVEILTVSLDGTITEGCANAALTLTLPNPTESDYILDYTIFGTAINGVDYVPVPLDLIIPAGDSTVTLDFIGIEDGIIEGIESIGIDIQRDACNRDTFFLYIRDNELVDPVLQNDTTICQGDTVFLDGTLAIALPDPPIFTNNTDFPLVTISNNNPPPPGTPPTISPIQVFGVQPVELQEGVIKRVCLDVDHNWISDVDAFLIGPNGQFLELTTDNGGSGDDYTQTCFTPEAITPINFGSQAPASAAPFTNDWSPEGNWSDLWDISDPLTNGTWELQIKDDQSGLNGTLLGWSICFNPLYQIDYSWTPSAGLSCDDCPDPAAAPDSTTTYYLTATDTYGCEVFDSITITVLETLPPPDVNCTTITDNSIEFCWPAIPGSVGYEVNVDGMGWMLSNNGLCHIAGGLTLEDTVMIEVRGLGQCNGQIDTAICWTPSCTPPTASLVTQTNVNCYGESTGAAQINAMGINPPFQYQLIEVDTNTTGTFVGLAAGDYTVLVLDNVNCPQSINFTITQPDTITTNGVLVNNAACNGGMDGSVTVEVNGGVGPYSFVWNVPGQTDSIATSLTTGDYIVTVTDFNGCSAIDTVEVTQPPVMMLALTVDSVSCAGAADGSSTVIVNGGVGPYTYLWSPSAANQITPTAVGLDGGPHTVTVTDINGCTSDALVVVVENTPINLAITGTDINCFGGSDGSAVVTASGGTGMFTYQWNDLTQITDTAQSQPSGMATVIVTDSDGCFNTAQIMLDQPATPLMATILTTSTLCDGDNSGTATVTAIGGTGPYTYAWADDPLETGDVRPNLLGGDYTVITTDANGCTFELTGTVGEATELSLAFISNAVGCFGNNDGFATVNPSGGDGNYGFQWDAAANDQTTQVANNLTEGTYFVTVTDGNNCTMVGSVIVTQPTELVLSEQNIAVACFGNSTGSIDLNIAGGTEPYTIGWTGPNSYTSALEDINSLPAGTYDVVVTDANNCTETINVLITQPSTGIMSSISAPDTICFQAGSGAASVVIGGGTGPYTYAWSNNQNGPTISNLDDGIYYVTITDGGNCTFIDTAYVVEMAEISVELSQTATLCHDGTDGTATIERILAGNSTMSMTDYNIAWSVSGQNGTTVSNLTGGQSYSVTVTDARGCTATQSITIGNPQEIGSRFSESVDPLCFGGNDGRATVEGDGGVAPYSFQWGPNGNNQVSATITDLTAGTYLVTVMDDNGCETSNAVVIAQPDRLDLQFDTEDVECPDDRNGSIVATATGGAPDYSYAWSNNNDSTNTIAELSAGAYELTITDNNGCTWVEQTSVSAPDILDADILIEDVTCNGDRDGSLEITAFGGNPPYSYSLDGEAYGGADFQVGLVAGEYPIYLQDAKGCIAELGNFTITEPPAVEVDLGDDIYIDFADSVRLNPDVKNNVGNTFYTYTLEDSLTLSCWDCPRPYAMPSYTTQYELVVVDENGCVGEDRITVYVEKDRLVYVPTGFSPNGDGANDRLVVHGKQVERVLMFRVFDRWGEIVHQDERFAINDLDRGWDGRFKGERMNPGVYVWYAEVLFEDGRIDIFKGNTTLIR